MIHPRRTLALKNNVKALCQERGMTARNLVMALQGKVTKGTVYKWFCQYRQPNKDIVQALCEIFECEAKELFYVP